MATEDRERWDVRHGDAIVRLSVSDLKPPDLFADHVDLFPTSGTGLDIACGLGRGSLWLAQRELDVLGIDVSPVAIEAATAAAANLGLSTRCRFEVVDLDDGLPDGPPVDVITCHRFRDVSLYEAMVERLVPGGLLAVAVLSQVGGEPGPFRAEPGELTTAFHQLDILVEHEAEGSAVLIGRRSFG